MGLTQNGLKWILNTTLENVTFCWRDPPHFLTKMTQNGLKWILNTTFKNVTFVTIFFLFEGFPYHNINGSLKSILKHEKNQNVIIAL